MFITPCTQTSHTAEIISVTFNIAYRALLITGPNSESMFKDGVHDATDSKRRLDHRRHKLFHYIHNVIALTFIHSMNIFATKVKFLATPAKKKSGTSLDTCQKFLKM